MGGCCDKSNSKPKATPESQEKKTPQEKQSETKPPATSSPPTSQTAPALPKQKVMARVTFILGGPGAGKGTVCKRLVESGQFVHLSAGDLLREERSSGSSVAELIESCIVEGKIVPAYVTVGLLRKAMEKSGWSLKTFLIDGFPRNFENFEAWKRDMTDVEIKGLTYVTCPEEVMMNRVMGRSESRSDDNIESFRKRLVVFHEQTSPVIEHFRTNYRVFEVNGDQPADAVYEQAFRLLSSA